MGHKHSTANWSVDDWAFGTGANAVQLEDVMEEAKTIPARYFGGKVIGNDISMQQMQRDLVQFDDVFKRVFRRKKNKRSKEQNNYDEQNYAENQEYIDQNHQPIPEEEEDQVVANRF